MPELPPLPALREDWQRALGVAAHPDDLEYGTASAVAHWTSQGKQVTYLFATRGEAGIASVHPDEAAALREEEERSGAREVGVEVVEFLDYRTGRWSTDCRCVATSPGPSGAIARRSSSAGHSPNG